MSMLLPDVNIFLYALREELPLHGHARHWLGDALNGERPVAIHDSILASVVRIATNPRAFKTPTPLPLVLDFTRSVRNARASVMVPIHNDVWDTFERLCKENALTGNDIPDAYLAAPAISLGAKFVTADAGFKRFQELNLELLQ